MEEEKKKIRMEAKKRRSLVDRKGKDQRIAAHVFLLPEYQKAETVFSYVSFRDEVDTRQIIERAWADGKRVACPLVKGWEMEFYEVCSWEELRPGKMGIPEPGESAMAVPAGESPCLMLMPGLAFDRERRRIGYGGGYYDRYLRTRQVAFPKAALAYTEQIWERLPSNAWDIRPDMIITEEGIINGSDYNGAEGETGGSRTERDGLRGKE